MVVIRGVRLWKKRASRDLELCRRTEANTSGKETLKVLPVLNGSLPFVVSLAVGLAVVIQEAALRMDVVKSFPATIFLSNMSKPDACADIQFVCIENPRINAQRNDSIQCNCPLYRRTGQTKHAATNKEAVHSV
jgi:hypothetical protein